MQKRKNCHCLASLIRKTRIAWVGKIYKKNFLFLLAYFWALSFRHAHTHSFKYCLQQAQAQAQVQQTQLRNPV